MAPASKEHTCMCVYVCTLTYVGTYERQRSMVVFILMFKTGSLTEPGVPYFS